MPVPDRPFQARYVGPYIVEKKGCDLNYIITTPDRRKQKQLCHINMLKEYVDRDSLNGATVNVISSGPQNQSEVNCEEVDCEGGSKPIKQHPYRMNTTKLQSLREEIQYLFTFLA